ncbi:hypothetical protein Tco_1103889 [Tanacetum coccineum]
MAVIRSLCSCLHRVLLRLAAPMSHTLNQLKLGVGHLVTQLWRESSVNKLSSEGGISGLGFSSLVWEVEASVVVSSEWWLVRVMVDMQTSLPVALRKLCLAKGTLIEDDLESGGRLTRLKYLLVSLAEGPPHIISVYHHGHHWEGSIISYPSVMQGSQHAPLESSRISSWVQNQARSPMIGLRVRHQWVEAGPPWVPHPLKVLSTQGAQASVYMVSRRVMVGAQDRARNREMVGLLATWDVHRIHIR